MSKEVLDFVLKTLDKAVVTDVAVYDMKDYTPYYDWSVICSVSSSRQGNAAMSYLKKDADEMGLSVRCSSVFAETRWFLVDLGSIVVHIFVSDERERYNLDGIYSNQLVSDLE